MEHKRKKGKENTSGEMKGWGNEGVGKGMRMPQRKREKKSCPKEEGMGSSKERTKWVPHLKGFYLEVPREDHNRIFIIFPDVFPQGYGLH